MYKRKASTYSKPQSSTYKLLRGNEGKHIAQRNKFCELLG